MAGVQTTAETDTFPPSYEVATGQHASLSGELNFIDFIPQCVDPGSLFSKPIFEPFNVLIDRANSWLQTTPSWKVKTCESVEFKTRFSSISYENMMYYERGDNPTWYIRGLRLWIVPCHDPSHPVQQIGFINVVPEKSPDGSLETLNAIVERFNRMLQSHPLSGRILTIETQEMKLPSYNAFDPNKSLWINKRNFLKKFVYVMRVFYEMSEPANEIIGIASFVPNALKEGGLFSLPVFEPFSNVMMNAFQWCSQQQGIRFCNAQSVEIKMKSGYIIDSQRMSYTVHGEKRMYYVRILRLAFTKFITPPTGCITRNPPILNLTCKTFMPIQVGTRLFLPKFETLSETRCRVIAWVKATSARIVSAETCALRMFNVGDANYNCSLTHSHPKSGEYWIFAFRLYLDGFYAEPPVEVLPPLPVAENSSCVIL